MIHWLPHLIKVNGKSPKPGQIVLIWWIGPVLPPKACRVNKQGNYIGKWSLCERTVWAAGGSPRIYGEEQQAFPVTFFYRLTSVSKSQSCQQKKKNKTTLSSTQTPTRTRARTLARTFSDTQTTTLSSHLHPGAFMYNYSYDDPQVLNSSGKP